MLNVLIIDDDPSFQETYRSFLERQGYRSRSAGSRARAVELWSEEQFDVVLLDLRLQGAAVPEEGIDLLDALKFSTAKVIVITGNASDDSIRRAFELGAYDYLVKGLNVTPALLAAKLDQVRELVRARQRGERASEKVIQDLWLTFRSGTIHARGRQLEELILRLLCDVPGFHEASCRLRTSTEELDVVIRNESLDEFWRKQGSYFLVEAKNWSHSVGAQELRDFGTKLQRRKASASLGFFVAPGGFTNTLAVELREWRSEGVTLVPVDREGLERLVIAPDRSQVLKELHVAAALGG
jgi:DNA-binding response OmpR family regulator